MLWVLMESYGYGCFELGGVLSSLPSVFTQFVHHHHVGIGTLERAAVSEAELVNHTKRVTAVPMSLAIGLWRSDFRRTSSTIIDEGHRSSEEWRPEVRRRQPFLAGGSGAALKITSYGRPLQVERSFATKCKKAARMCFCLSERIVS